MPDLTFSFDDNEIFKLAKEFVVNTSRCIFLTGKAGTGKTTFLRHIKDITEKKTVVVAPTGVAAINAGGTTIHSFFQLPFSPFVPVGDYGSVNDDWSNNYNLLKNIKIESEKRSLFREMELLIIDEVSMLRCDVLDSIDLILRYFRKKRDLPFGGVQVLFIGDLFQLPPVVPDDQWMLLSRFYHTPFFFSARVIKNCRLVYIELKKIYRQRDAAFVELLNKIRTNEVSEKDLVPLNNLYAPGYKLSTHDNYITLTTHNAKADKFNFDALNELPGEVRKFQAIVEGDFPERSYPTDATLSLKEGAQVMFIKNDMEKIRRYYNGKIGVVRKITDDEIVVGFYGEEGELAVEKETWKNILYSFNNKTRQIEEEIIGTFTQYAIRLAWAITIHKSQGLTFEKVIIDAGDSFAPGQVYVALSRCTSLEGIVLRSRIFRSGIMSDKHVIQFAEEELLDTALKPLLDQERMQFLINTLIAVFDWGRVVDEIELFITELGQRKFKDKEAASLKVNTWKNNCLEQLAVANKFQHQIRQISSPLLDVEFLEQRVEAAITYFDKHLTDLIADMTSYKSGLSKKSKVKKYVNDLIILISFLETFNDCIKRSGIIVKELKTFNQIEKANPA